jgi:hypothetical protein
MLAVGSLEVTPLPGYRPATSWVHYTASCNTQSSAPEDGLDHCPKHSDLFGIINKPLFLHLVGVYIIISMMHGQRNIPLQDWNLSQWYDGRLHLGCDAVFLGQHFPIV